MPHSKPPFEFEGPALVASALHAQLLDRRRATFEHDFKNVIHGLMSGTELLSRALASDTPRITPAECVALLQQQLGRTRETLQKMLDEIAPPPTPPGPIALAALIEECLKDVRHDVHRIEVASTLPTDSQVHAPRKLLKDAFLFLLLEAADAPQRRTSLQLSSRAEGDSAIIELTGPRKEDAEHPASLTVIATVLRGENIELDYSAHEDVRVTLRIPLIAAPAARDRILIVDGHRDTADSLAMLAQLEGWDARAAHDIDTALRLIHEHTPAAILVDIDGSLDSAALVARLRAAGSARIIAMSHDELAPGVLFDRVARKPLDIQSLAEALGH
jgi:CheY-like chemotaxis protein